MGVSFSFAWEVKLMEWMQTAAGRVTASLATLMSALGEEIVLVALVGFLYWCYDKNWGKFAAVRFLPMAMSSTVIKNIVLRRRPYMDNKSIRCLRKIDNSADEMDVAAQGYSFPSMHSGNAVSIYGSLAACIKKRWAWVMAVVFSLMVGFSRVFVGMHYPTDVLAGWLLGAVVAVGVSLLQRLLHHNTLALAIVFVVLGLPGWFVATSNDFFSVYGLTVGMMFGFCVEEKFVDFENTRQPLRCVVRLLVGLGIFLAGAECWKLFLPASFVSGVTFSSHLFRTFRYAFGSFIAVALYPMAFRRMDHLWKKT